MITPTHAPRTMTRQQAIDLAATIGNYPANMPEHARTRYQEWQAEVWFCENHGINAGYVEATRDAKHRLIAYYLHAN